MLTQSAIDSFRAQLRGALIQPEDPEYDQARRVYNAMIDRYPRMIAACADVADVIDAVNFAREHDLLLAVRGGMHNGGGFGVCDGGLVIDLSRLRGIRVDPAARTARVDGGCTLGAMDHATHAFGLAAPAGIISTTGVGGLTLGGGIGHLTRRYGLTIDNLIGADLVLADGRFVAASAEDHADLFWAIRGGGGNFGVATSFLFRLHPVREVVAGPSFWPLEQADEVLRWYREFILAAPEDLNGFFMFLTVPPAPAFPATLHGKKMCAVMWCYAGHAQEAQDVFAPVRRFGPPVFDGLQTLPYPVLQSLFDPLYPPGLQWYWRADFVDTISDAAIAVHTEYGPRMPTPGSSMHLYPIDGAAHRVGAADTAFSYRSANWAAVIVGVDADPANKSAITSWTRAYWEALHPHCAAGAYVNFMMEEGDARVRATYGNNYPRLAAIKRRYDPENLFRVNQNIPPA